MIPRSFVFGFLVFAAGISWAQQEEERGLKLHEPEAFDGLNLFSPLEAGTTYLIDNEGRVIHTWESEYRPASVPYLMPNGNILRPGSFGTTGNGTFRGGGAGYLIEEFTWDGEKIWEFVYSSDQHLMHHDVAPLPNGNLLILAWEMKTREEAIAAGRDPELLRGDELWSEHIIEVTPVRPEGAEIVWEWHLWDHLIQDFDETKENYRDVAAHPELVDINPPNGRSNSDWLHINAIAYNSEHDLIALSIHSYSELWILDHSPAAEVAKGHTGGRYGKGGDLLYRWGNPRNYRLGEEADQQLFAQHDVHWISEGRPGAGNLLVFNNGGRRSDGNYSSVVEIEPPFTKERGFQREEGNAWGPEKPVWEYTAPNKEDFSSVFISGARRQPNGNTLICSGASGTFFEVTQDKKEVWRYVNPVDTRRDESAGRDQGGRGSFLRYAVFRVHRYPRDYSAFVGKELAPGPPLIDYLKDQPARTPKNLDDEL